MLKRCFSSIPVGLNKLERTEFLGPLQNKSGWKINFDQDAISKQFLFTNFDDAWRFMTKVADYAKELDHHPEWSNVYNKVDMTLSTHDCKGLSMRDVKLAQFADIAALRVKEVI